MCSSDLDSNEAVAYAKILLTEKVTAIKLMDFTGKAEAATSYEAGAEAETSVVFKSALEGSLLFMTRHIMNRGLT